MIIPIIPANDPPTDTAIIVTKALTLFVLPYILGEITYPSSWGKTIQIIMVPISTGVETTKDVIIPIILVINPPKYGITVVTQARIPKSNQFGWPTNQKRKEYSNNWIIIKIESPFI